MVDTRFNPSYYGWWSVSQYPLYVCAIFIWFQSFLLWMVVSKKAREFIDLQQYICFNPSYYGWWSVRAGSTYVQMYKMMFQSFLLWMVVSKGNSVYRFW